MALGEGSDRPRGLRAGVPPSVYHERRVGLVSKSALDLINRSPAHYKAWVDGAEQEETEALAYGSAFHCALLEPDRFEQEYAVAPDFGDCRFKANKAARDAWSAENAGVALLSADDHAKIVGMVDAVRRHPLAGRIFSDGQAELTIRWTDDETGLECKSRADYYVRKLGMVADVKSTLDGRADAFRRDVAKYRYHVQDALYRAGFTEVGEPVQHFVFIPVEKTPPHAVAVYALDSEAVAKGYAAARRNIATMAECLKRGEWPGYPTAIQTLSLPPWVD